jgi:hypothetical protein
MAATANQMGQFVLGLVISLVLSAVAAAIVVGSAVLLYFSSGSAFAIILLFLIVAGATLALIYRLARSNRARARGAMLFFPAAVLVIYVGFQLRWWAI